MHGSVTQWFSVASFLWGLLCCLALSGAEVPAQQRKAEFKDAARAVFGRRLEELRKLNDNTAGIIDLRDPAGFSLAHFAAGVNCVEILRYISEHAPSTLASQASDGTTPAFVAAQEGSVESLEFLATRWAVSFSVPRKDGLLPSHIAAHNDNYECLSVLARHAHETLTRKDSKGNTPAHLACEVDAVQSLLFLKTKLVEQDFRLANEEGKTPLEVCRKKGSDRCERVLLDRPLTDEQIGFPASGGWVSVTAKPAAVRLFQRWTSALRPEHKVSRRVVSRWSSLVSQDGFWDFRPETNPDRLIFFTRAHAPLTNLSELDPSGKAGQFAFWDGSLTDHAFHFLAKADLVRPEDRKGYGIWIMGHGYFADLFRRESKLKLFMTHSIHEDAIRKAGGVPVKFVISLEGSPKEIKH